VRTAPQFALTGQRIYAQQFEEFGVDKVKFVHQRLAEFNNTTGPHGGEVVITEHGAISVLVAPYNSAPSSNTAVGISPGNGVDTVAAQPTPFGRDLTSDFAAAPTMLPIGGAGFEVFDLGLEFDGQYLIIGGQLSDTANANAVAGEDDLEQVTRAIDAFGQQCGKIYNGWQATLAEIDAKGGRPVIWGAGSKGVAFLSTLGVRDAIRYAVDGAPIRTERMRRRLRVLRRDEGQ